MHWRMGFPRLCFSGGWIWARSRLFFALGVLGGAGTCGVPLRALAPSRVWGFQAPEIVGGRGTWSVCVRDGVTVCGLGGVGPLGGGSWRASVRRCQVLPTPESGTTAAP